MRYLVIGSGGPGFTSPEEGIHILESEILPTFDLLLKLETEKKIVAGGLPVGARELTFVLEARSHEEADELIRSLPAWGALDWEVTPLEPFAARAAQERRAVEEYRKAA